MDADNTSSNEEDPDENLDEDDGTPKKVPCESIRITYEDPLTKVHRAEEVFLDPRDLWSRGKSLLLVNAASITALQEQSDKEQFLAFSSQSATERCRRDYLREQRVLVDELQRMVECNPGLTRAIQVEAQEAIDKAMQVAEQSPDLSAMAFTEDEKKLALEFFVPRNDTDDEILKVLKQAQVDLGDEVCMRLMLQKVRGMNADDLRKRDQLREALETLSSSGLVTDSGPVGKDSQIKLIHTLIIQAQNQGASWTEIAMTVMEAASNRWSLLKEEGYTQNVLQATEDSMTNHLRDYYLAMASKQKEYSTKLVQFYALLAQQEEHAATLMEMQSKAEVAEQTLTRKEAASAKLVSDYEQRKAERSEKREQVKAERQAARSKAKQEARRHYHAMKSELQEAINEEEEVVSAPDAVVKAMSVQEKARLQQLEEVVSQMQQKQTAIKSKIESLHTEASEAKEMKAKTRERVAAAKANLLQRKQEVQTARAEVARVEEKKQVLKKEANDLAQKRAKVDQQVMEVKTPLPPDIDSMLAKLEAEVEGVRAPYQELCQEESRLLAKERLTEQRIEEARESLKARRDEPSPPEPPPPPARPRSTTEGSAISTVSTRLLRGYPQRVASQPPSVPRFEHLYADLRAREKQLQKRQEESAEAEAREVLQRMPKLSDEEKSQRSHRSTSSQVPVGFYRDEDLRVKIALSAQSSAELTKVLEESDRRVHALKQDLQATGRSLAESFAQSAERLAEVPPQLSEVLEGDKLRDAALRSHLQSALRTHEECREQAQDVWRLAEAGCNTGARQQELELEECACGLREEDLLQACRHLYHVAEEAADTAPTAAMAARSFAAQWEKAERPRLSLWKPVLSAAAALEAERGNQEAVSNQLYLEAKRKALLEAELFAPAEAKRALASLRHLTASEGPPAHDPQLLS